MNHSNKEISEHNKHHYGNNADLFQAIMGSHIHWGYFKDDSLSLAAAQEALVDNLLSFVTLDQHKTLLDVGCGIGGTVMYIHQNCGCRAFGITNNEREVRLAKERAQSRKCGDGVEIFLADAVDNGQAPDVFDVVIMVESAYMVPDKMRLLQENYRVLKPGGSLLICDNMTERNLTTGEMFKYYQQINALKEIFGEGKYEALDSYRKMTKNAGFKESFTYDISKEVFPTIERVLCVVETKREELLKQFTDKTINLFETCWKYTKELCEKEISTYGIVHAIK